MRTDTFTSFERKHYSGLIDYPEQKKVPGIIVLIPGSGKTKVAAEDYAAWQKKFSTGENVTDTQTELLIYVPELKQLLSGINCPFLAINGTKDSQVDWQETAHTNYAQYCNPVFFVLNHINAFLFTYGLLFILKQRHLQLKNA